MAEDTPDPKQTSSDYDAMSAYWTMVDAILCGAEAMRGKTTSGPYISGPVVPVSSLELLGRGRVSNPSPYLPQFPNETSIDYELRRRNAPFTNIYADISRNLSSKPFSKTCQLEEGTAPALVDLSDNIDGQGNNLHVVASNVFKSGIDYGLTWILVDYNQVPDGLTLAAERAIGARPYWVHIPAERIRAVYSASVAGMEVIVHARIYEPSKQRDGYSETTVERVRILNREPILDEMGDPIGYGPATWAIWEEISGKDTSGKDSTTWVLKAEGPITIGIIPLVAFATGKREGWKVEPPLRDLAWMQVEEFQQESNLKTIKELTAFPMLAGNGVPPPTDASGNAILVPVGPRAVLFAPPNADGSNGAWAFIEPTAASLTFLQSDLEKTRTEMRDLGMQPLATANLTVVTTANVSMKAHNAVQAWALGLKDALELAWQYTGLWLNRIVEPVVDVHLDFGVDLQANTELDALLKAEGQAIISKRTVQDEFKRRGVLSDDFDPDEEEQLLAEQQQGMEPDMPINPVTGQPIDTQPSNVVPMPPRNNGSAVNGFNKRMQRG